MTLGELRLITMHAGVSDALVRCTDTVPHFPPDSKLLIVFKTSYLAQAVLTARSNQPLHEGYRLDEARYRDHQTVQARGC
jgi:hypothetical protein